MLHKYRLTLIALSASMAFFNFGCSSLGPQRNVATQEKIAESNERSLKFLAQSGISLSTSPQIFKETSYSEVGECKVVEPITWHDQVYRIARMLEGNPQWAQKFHFIRFEKAGLNPKLEILGDLDQRTLVVHYSKRRLMKQIDVGDDSPCPEMLGRLIGETMTSVVFDWPNERQFAELLNRSPERQQVSSEGTESLVWLAERGYIVNVIGPQGEVLSQTPQNRWQAAFGGDAVRALPQTELLLRKIRQGSRQARSLGIFTVKAVSLFKAGLDVASVSEYSADINRQFDLTSPFVASNAGGLGSFESCVQQKVKESPSFKGYSAKSNSYLYPGFTCK